jgi:hypothetical protein
MQAAGKLTVFGTPSLQLSDNGVATFAGGSGTNTLIFRYTVQPGENSNDLQITALSLNSGRIQDATGNDLTGSVAAASICRSTP